MSKRELIDRIQLFNPTAASDFLRQFDEAQLMRYLSNLVETTPPVRRNQRRGSQDGPSEGAEVEGQPDPRQLALTF